MAIHSLARRAGVIGKGSASQSPIYVDSDDNIVKVIPASDGTTEVQIIDASSTQTLTNKTLTAPVMTAPASGTTGLHITKIVTFTEDATSVSHAATVAIPAGSIVHDIQLFTTVAWTDTQVVGDVGDTDDTDGYFAAVDIDATDLLVGEVLSTADDGLWGGKNGAYLTAAGRRGQAAGGNSGFYYGAATNILANLKVTTPSGTAGRSFLLVDYSTPTTSAATTS